MSEVAEAPAIGSCTLFRQRARADFARRMADDPVAQIEALRSWSPPWQGRTRVEAEGRFLLVTSISVSRGDAPEADLLFVQLENPAAGAWYSVGVWLTREDAGALHAQLGAALRGRRGG